MEEIVGVERPPLRWTIRLYEEAPGKRYAILAVALFAALLGWLLFHHALYALIGLFAILGSTTEFWAPIHCVMDEKGASLRCGISVSAIEWANVKRAIVFENSIKLSPLETDSKLSEFRGVTLRFGEYKNEIVERITEKVGESCLIFGKKN